MGDKPRPSDAAAGQLSFSLHTSLGSSMQPRENSCAGFSEPGAASRWSAHAILPNLRMAAVKTSESGLPNARGTAVYDRMMMMMMPAGRVCAAPLCSDSPIGRLLHCGASEQSVYCRCCARAVVERPISAATAPLSLSLSLLLSLSPGWRRLLLSAAWESEARHFPATAYSRCSSCWLRSWPSCGKKTVWGRYAPGRVFGKGRVRVCVCAQA